MIPRAIFHHLEVIGAHDRTGIEQRLPNRDRRGRPSAATASFARPPGQTTPAAQEKREAGKPTSLNSIIGSVLVLTAPNPAHR
jgi:hypothetical protein